MDLAEAHVASLAFILNSSPTLLTLNIGTGCGKSVLEVVETFKKVNNCDLRYNYSPRRKGDAPYVVANNNLALEKLNWTPKRDLNQMCEDAWRWKQNCVNSS